MSAARASWLELEQHALGELDSSASQRVAAAIATDAATRQRHALIESERAERTLPPLPALAAAKPPRRWAWPWSLGFASAAAAAAATLLFLCRGSVPVGVADYPDRQLGIKGGGELLLGLVRERNGTIDHQPGGFSAGDRFKVVVTCSTAASVVGEVVVVQAGAAFFPLPTVDFECGNRTVLPGAFSLSGEHSATVCLVLMAAREANPDLDASRAACISLTAD